MDVMGTNVASVEPIRAASSGERLRILLVAPPMVPVPPPTYAGTERVVAALGDELHQRGHAVTLVGAGDSDVAYELIPTVAQSLWSSQIDSPSSYSIWDTRAQSLGMNAHTLAPSTF